MNNQRDKKLRFDTIKIETSSENLIATTDLFRNEVNLQTGEVDSVVFNSKIHHAMIPFALYIRTNYGAHKMEMEFSSKILLDDYPQLISGDNFAQCLRNINDLGICTLNIEGIKADCRIKKAHITRDIDMVLNSAILNALNRCTGDYRRYKWIRYADNSIRFTKDVQTAKCKEEINIYNKEIEISHSKNKAFLSMVSNPEAIKDYFRGKTRFEMKLENMTKIKKELGLDDTKLDSLMEVESNPLLVQFDKIFTENSTGSITSLVRNSADYGMLNTVRLHDGDLKAIDQEIDDIGLYRDSSRGAKGKQMKKYKQMAQAWNNQKMNSDKVIDGIRNKLKY